MRIRWKGARQPAFSRLIVLVDVALQQSAVSSQSQAGPVRASKACRTGAG